MGNAHAAVPLAPASPIVQASPPGVAAGALPLDRPASPSAPVAEDTVERHGLGVPGGRKVWIRAFAAEAPAAGVLVASALPPPQHGGPLEPAILPWFSCPLGPRQSGRSPAHNAIACFGLQQGIGQGRGRNPLPQLGSGSRVHLGGLHTTKRTALALRPDWSSGPQRWYAFRLRARKGFTPRP